MSISTFLQNFIDHTPLKARLCSRKTVGKITFYLQSFNIQAYLPTFLQLKCAIDLNLMVCY